MDHEESLEKLGFTRLEARIYVGLLRLGRLSAGEITKNTGIHRRNVYDSLARLIEKGFVSYATVNRRKLFNASPPSRLLEFLGEKQESLRRDEMEARKILPEMESLPSRNPEDTDVSIFKGKDGMKSIMNDVLKDGKELLCFVADAKLRQLVQFYLPIFTEKRIKRKIAFKIIYDEELKGKAHEIYDGKRYTEIRFLRRENTPPVVMWVYGNKVALRPSEESIEDTVVILLKNQKIADSFRKYFELLWNAAKT